MNIRRWIGGLRYKDPARKRINGHRKRVCHIVMEQELGRKLKRGEVVHHIDGNNRHDNPSNLMLLDRDKHTALEREIEQHIREKGSRPSVQWQKKKLKNL